MPIAAEAKKSRNCKRSNSPNANATNSHWQLNFLESTGLQKGQYVFVMPDKLNFKRLSKTSSLGLPKHKEQLME
jgi:hypothetical protein